MCVIVSVQVLHLIWGRINKRAPNGPAVFIKFHSSAFLTLADL